jgi:hypothetical protein
MHYYLAIIGRYLYRLFNQHPPTFRDLTLTLMRPNIFVLNSTTGLLTLHSSPTPDWTARNSVRRCIAQRQAPCINTQLDIGHTGKNRGTSIAVSLK